MAAGGHFGFGPLTEFAHTFTTGTQANFFYLTFIDDKSIEKTTSALNGHGIAGDDPTTHGRSRAIESNARPLKCDKNPLLNCTYLNNAYIFLMIS